MKKISLIIAFLFAYHFHNAQSQQQINNLVTFSKLYGYVKYFHPSDEAAAVDWDKFAIYGCKIVENAKNTDELIAKLDSLFKPIAPSILLMKEEHKTEFDVKAITPSPKIGYKTIAWQHYGNGMDNPSHFPYKSMRVNTSSFKDEESDPYGSISKTINVEKFSNKKILLTAYVRINPKTKSKGKLWLSNKKVKISDEDKGDSVIRIKNANWVQYKIFTNLNKNAKYLSFGVSIQEKGELFADDFHLFYEEAGQWVEIPIANNSFEIQTPTDKENSWNTFGKGYFYTYSDSGFIKGSRSLSIKYVGVDCKNKKLFDKYPHIGETIKENIGNGIYLILPIALYGNKNGTYPKSNKYSLLKLRLAKTKTEDILDLNVRTADVIIAWNVFQHFYPYFDVIKTDWNSELYNALQKCYQCKNGSDFYLLLTSFLATLNDGHLHVDNYERQEFIKGLFFKLPIEWEWIENKLVITNVCGDSIKLKAGDIVEKINYQNPEDFFIEKAQYISAATVGLKSFLLRFYSLFGEKDSIILTLQNGDSVQLVRTDKVKCSHIKKELCYYKLYDSNIVYLNLNIIEMSQIDSLLPTLAKAKSIICDLRFYPKGNHGFISYLLEKPDTASQWMQIPEIIYPDHKNNGFKCMGWKMPVKKPHINAKIIFLIEGSAISYAESYLGLIEGYKLATIIGQPTAGTNGNVNSFNLPCGFYIPYTGMKVVKLNGSQLFGVGTTPDIYVNKTIKGVLEGRDEYLEKALEIARMK